MCEAAKTLARTAIRSCCRGVKVSCKGKRNSRKPCGSAEAKSGGAELRVKPTTGGPPEMRALHSSSKTDVDIFETSQSQLFVNYAFQGPQCFRNTANFEAGARTCHLISRVITMVITL